jgi:hypothetical protein
MTAHDISRYVCNHKKHVEIKIIAIDKNIHDSWEIRRKHKKPQMKKWNVGGYT